MARPLKRRYDDAESLAVIEDMDAMKIATYNANSIRSRLDIKVNWLKETDCDVLCEQETKLQDHQIPSEAYVAMG